MDFQQGLNDGIIRNIPPNNARARNLAKSSINTLRTAIGIKLDKQSAQTIIRDLYESLRQMIEAIGYSNGYKFSNHEILKSFLEMLGEKKFAETFDRYRKIRNGINYYGDEVSLETAAKARKEIPLCVEKLNEFI
jgi:hypothetical protein